MRTLTLKSLLKFGRFHDHTVGQMIQLEKHDYLRWAYYNCSEISFMPDVLQIIEIDHIITKPGVDREYHKEQKMVEVNKFAYRPGLDVAEASILKRKGDRSKKRKAMQIDRIIGPESKLAMRSKNQKT